MSNHINLRSILLQRHTKYILHTVCVINAYFERILPIWLRFSCEWREQRVHFYIKNIQLTFELFEYMFSIGYDVLRLSNATKNRIQSKKMKKKPE